MTGDAPPLTRRVSWAVQALLAAVAFSLIGLLPFRVASGMGGWIGRTVGPRMGLSRRARRNLRAAFPDKSDADIETIVHGMWDNLGRSAFEYPHLSGIDFSAPDCPVEIVGREHLERLRADGKPGLLFSAHMGNWELAAVVIGKAEIDAHAVYRAPNNPYMQALFRRRGADAVRLIEKGPQGARQALKALSDGAHLGMLVDQKMNDGIAVPFFGRDAMTAPALAQFALKFDCPVVPARVERVAGARSRVTFHPPLDIRPTGDRHADIAAIMAAVNATLESWIREKPEQWLWLHNRWPD